MKGNITPLYLAGSLRELNKVENFVESIADRYHLNDSYFANMMVALTEAFTNACVHGNANDPSKMVKIDFEVSDHELVFHVSDEGPGFEYWYYNQFQESFQGRGLLLIRSVSDKVSFNEAGNVISLHFNTAAVKTDVSRSRKAAFEQHGQVKQTRQNEKKNL